jgi:hypothetical protein
MRDRLADEIGLSVHPVQLGAGNPRLPADGATGKLKLVEARPMVEGACFQGTRRGPSLGRRGALGCIDIHGSGTIIIPLPGGERVGRGGPAPATVLGCRAPSP